MNITRRSLVLGAAATVPLVSTIRFAGAQTAEFNYKYANNLPLTHPMNKRAQEAVDKIREETGGRVAIQIFPSNQLGADTDMLSQVLAEGAGLRVVDGREYAFEGFWAAPQDKPEQRLDGLGRRLLALAGQHQGEGQ